MSEWRSLDSRWWMSLHIFSFIFWTNILKDWYRNQTKRISLLYSFHKIIEGTHFHIFVSESQWWTSGGIRYTVSTTTEICLASISTTSLSISKLLQGKKRKIIHFLSLLSSVWWKSRRITMLLDSTTVEFLFSKWFEIICWGNPSLFPELIKLI